MDVVASFSSSIGSEAVSSLLTVPNDDSGTFLVISIALFISKAVRAKGSLLLSFAGDDTACLVETTHRDAACAAVQHGISAAFALEALRAGRRRSICFLANFSSTCVDGSNVAAQVCTPLLHRMGYSQR